MEDFTLSMRTYLAIKTMERANCSWLMAVEAVNTTILAHPEWGWDTDVRRTFPEWEVELDKGALGI